MTRPAYPRAQAVNRTSDTTRTERVTSSVPAAEQRHPDDGPEQEPEEEPAEGEELDEGPEPQPVDGGQQHQPDDQQVDPIHRCEGSRTVHRGNAAPTAIVVLPCFHDPCFTTGVSGDAVAACS